MKTIIIAILAVFSLVLNANATDYKLEGKTIKTEAKAKEAQPTMTGYSINVDGKVYQILKGKRGGYYYINSKGKKTYLNKKQKALLK